MSIKYVETWAGALGRLAMQWGRGGRGVLAIGLAEALWHDTGYRGIEGSNGQAAGGAGPPHA